MNTELDRTKSVMQKTINRLMEECTKYMKGNHYHKAQVRKFSQFITMLKEQDRVSNEELKEYFKPKKDELPDSKG